MGLNPEAVSWRKVDGPMPSPPSRPLEELDQAVVPEIRRQGSGSSSPTHSSSPGLSEVSSVLGEACCPGSSDLAAQPTSALPGGGGSWCPRFSTHNAEGALVVKTPWYPTGRSKTVLKLRDEMWDFHRFMAPSAAERQQTATLRCALQDNTARVCPHATVKLVGSHATGFCLHDSSADFVVEGCDGVAEFVGGLESSAQLQVLAASVGPTPESSCLSVRAEGAMQGEVFFTEGRSEARSTATFLKSQLQKWPSAAPVATVLRTVLRQVRCVDWRTGGISPYVVQLIALDACSKAKDPSDPALCLREALSTFANVDLTSCALAPLSDELAPPKENSELGCELVVRDPQDPSRNLAVSCRRLVAIRQQLLYCQQALAKWECRGSSRGYKGRTPLSTIISLQPLWSRSPTA